MSLKNSYITILFFLCNTLLSASDNGHQRRWLPQFFRSCTRQTAAINSQARHHIPFESEENEANISEEESIIFLTDAIYIEHNTADIIDAEHVIPALVENDIIERLQKRSQALQSQNNKLKIQVHSLKKLSQQERKRFIDTLLSKTLIEYNKNCLAEENIELKKIIQQLNASLEEKDLIIKHLQNNQIE